MTQEPDFGSSMPDTFADLGNISYGTAIDDYQAQMDDFDLKGPNAQFLASNASYDEEGSSGNQGDRCCFDLIKAKEEIEELETAVAELEEELTETVIDNCKGTESSKAMVDTILDGMGKSGIKPGGYYKALSGSVCRFQLPPPLPCMSISCTFIIYERTDGAIRYLFQGRTANTRPQDERVMAKGRLTVNNPSIGPVPADGVWHEGATHVEGWSNAGIIDILGFYFIQSTGSSDIAPMGTFPPLLTEDPCVFTLTYVASAGGTISGPSTEQIKAGAPGSIITAIPSLGQQFNGWSDGSTDPTYRATNVSESATITANFGPIQA